MAGAHRDSPGPAAPSARSPSSASHDRLPGGHPPKTSLKQRAAAWCSAAFGIDTRALGAFRISLALLLLLDLALRSADLRAHYTDWGLLPRSGVIDHLMGDLPFVSIYFLSGNTVVTGVLFAMAACFALCLLVGCRTRPATALSWFMLSSLHTRNPMILQGGDVLLRMLLFWAIFLPLDARFTLRRNKGGTNSINKESVNDAPKESANATATVVSVASAALLLQVGIVYFFGALLKSDPVWTVQHTAIYNALSIEQFSTATGRWLLRFPTILKALTVTTLWLELIGPWVAILPIPFWKSRRTVMVLAFVGFHISMSLCLHLGLFSIICSVAWIPFLPAQVWNRLDTLLARVFPKKSSAFQTPHSTTTPARTLRLPFAANALALFFLLYVIAWNIRTVYPKFDTPAARHLDWVADLFRFDQTWDMFAPAPLREDGWYVVPGLLADGTMADIRHDTPVDWQKPPVTAADYKNDRWRKYMVNLAAQPHTWYRGPYSEYLRRNWDATHPPQKRLLSVWIYYMMTLNRLDGGKDKPVPLLLWNYNWK